jgi:DNA-binding transcriptional ArsR family regulator
MEKDISAVAALMGDRTRANMLMALMGGIALPAGELAMCANISPQTASAHLAKLVEGKLLCAEVQGRHRYYRLAGPEIAGAIEALGAIAPRQTKTDERQAGNGHESENPLRYARTCYSHFAGALAVEINDAFHKRGLLAPAAEKQYRVTTDGQRWFEKLGIDINRIKSSRAGLARQCLDWTERRHHLAGPLGSALLEQFFVLKWMARIGKTRAVRVTHKGQERLTRLLGIRFRRSSS